MAMDGSDSHGEADTLAENNFGPDFKEYVLKEQLKWSSHKQSFYDKWVFWSEQDHEIEPSLSLDNCADFNLNVCAIPKVRDNIRRALQKLMLSLPWFNRSLVQFWAATKTLEGRTLLTTRYEPFALGEAFDPSERVPLCNYRMEMCRKYNCFYADAESGEEQLGLPGRVFLHQFPESIRQVEGYTTKEYPQRDLALRSDIRGSWAMPVFEHSSQTCVGVLEMVYLRRVYWLDENFLDNVNKSFQEFGLRCCNGNQYCMLSGEDEYWKKAGRVEGLTHACQELRTVLTSVCQFHKLPLAMTWVACSACDGLRTLKVNFCSSRSRYRAMFLKANEWSHLRKGLVFGRALSSPNMLYCSNINKLSLDEYPLVPYARLCKLSGWFTICLQNVYTGNDIYVLEFFLSARSEDDVNILTTLSFILGTMEKNFKTFRLASGKELGELMSLEVIYFQNDQKIQFVQSIQATRDFSRSSIQSSVQSSPSVANTGQGSHDANMVTSKAKYDLNCDPFSDSDSSSDSDPSFMQSSTRVANARPRFQDADLVTIKVKYASTERVLKLSLPCRLVELQEEVAIWLAGTYHVGYKDEEDGFVLIACDEDLQAYIDDSISQGNASPTVLLEPKEPATNFNPNN